VNGAAELNEKRISPAYRRYALAVMTAVYTCNLLDRFLMGLLLQPIKEDLRLSDTQLGFLTGIAFGLFYATLGLPIARWADRGNRVTITSLAIGLWGLTVMACLFVTNYFHLVVARIAAAVGESGCKPPTLSLLGDYFPQSAARTRAMSIWWLGAPLATLISFIVGGRLNELYGWRIAFFLMGVPGLLLAVLVKFTLVEPRTRSGNPDTQNGALPTLKEVIRILWHRRSCRHLTLALILFFTMGFGLDPWNTAFMMRSHGIGTAELGIWFGLISSAGGIVGLLSGSYVANRWFADNERGQMHMCAVSIAATVPCYVAFLLLPQKHMALIMLMPWMLVINFFVGPVYALMQRLVPDEMRATTMALVMLLYNLIGMGLGPQVVGILSDSLSLLLGSDSLRYAMLSMSFVALWSAYHFWEVGRTVKEDLAELAQGHQFNANCGDLCERALAGIPRPPAHVSSFDK
jgi:predicted MFS family arabinose efflux permease